MTILILEVLFWVALVNVWRYRGKVSETRVAHPDKEELINLYIGRRDTWSVIMWLSLIVQWLIIWL